ncbi:putative aminoglycoside 6'-N-acetyltransferase [Burkholderia humptydooensis]|nr:putative aminoglycoside 6'-N-acetyltransferase [Burkholderia sp. 2002721687]ALX45002.1 hypothetical protein AQ610_20960 [Burkholderia humptydooensis]
MTHPPPSFTIRAAQARDIAQQRDAPSHACSSSRPPENAASHALHRALGFGETERIVFFRKTLAR